MNGGSLTRACLADYARNPVNLLLLVVAPLAFVTISAGALADFAGLLGGAGERTAVEAATAGWAAAFLAGVAGYFQVVGAHNADRRLCLAGARPERVVAARLATALCLAVVASAGGLIALAARAGVVDVPRAVLATLTFAVIYVGLGALVGALVRDELNGAALILFIWIVDVFFGPTMSGSDALLTRAFPTHFPSLVAVGSASGHAGPAGDVGLSVAWAVGSLTLAALALRWRLGSIRTHRRARRRGVARRAARAAVFPLVEHRGRPAPGEAGTRPARDRPRLIAAAVSGFREYRRNPVLWVLLVIVPVVFISIGVAITPDDPIGVGLTERGDDLVRTLSMFDVHAATMGAYTIAALAGLAGLFVSCDAVEADGRLVVAGFRARELMVARAATVAAAALVVSAVSLAVTFADFTPQRWGAYIGANLALGAAYGALGVLLGPLVGRIGGLYLVFLVPFIDLGVGQSPMLRTTPPAWAEALPGYGPLRLLVDSSFTADFDQLTALLATLAWLAALSLGALAVFRRATGEV